MPVRNKDSPFYGAPMSQEACQREFNRLNYQPINYACGSNQQQQQSQKDKAVEQQMRSVMDSQFLTYAEKKELFREILKGK